MTETSTYDILIAGAGFAGSLTALILDKLGFKVCLVEKGKHPRFAIGESSTPIADMMLRKLAAEYDLPWLHDFSRYGSWQLAHPEVVCGLKRGFSFFKHYTGMPFTADAQHTNELLVAASIDNVQSDTNWLRADFDAFIVNKVKEAGITYLDQTGIVSAERDAEWTFQLVRPGESCAVCARFFIDATGGGNLMQHLLRVKSTTNGFLTNSFAVFSHFYNVPRWTHLLQQYGISINDFPYDPDNSALHHVLDEGWMWVLRFNDGRTSLGLVLDGHEENYSAVQPAALWNTFLNKYPSISSMLKDVPLAAQPGTILRSDRLQRRVEKCFGPGWAVLPHTAGFVDPLFSSGIAHSLTGIVRVVNILHRHWSRPDALQHHFENYEHAVFAELTAIDQLVAGCYKTMPHFGLFNAWSMLYFAATIAYEQKLTRREEPGYFLCADDPYITGTVQSAYRDLLQILANGPSPEAVQRFTDRIRRDIAPLNTAKLLDPSLKNMYRHTASPL